MHAPHPPAASTHAETSHMNSTLVHTAAGFDLRVDPNDFVGRVLLKNKIFEAPESEVVSQLVRPGDTCVDAGCQVGYYSCLMAKLVGEQGRVYSFDANPRACKITQSNLALNKMHWVEVSHVALADRDGEAEFYVSTDDQTGLSSLGPISPRKDVITVPRARLEDLLNRWKLERIRLLKIDVEGAEEIVLRGLGHFLTDHRVDFVLAECYDERLRLLNTSTERVWAILSSAGYQAWHFTRSAGWSPTINVQSRHDCNYLFASPSALDPMRRVSKLRRFFMRLLNGNR